MIIGGCFSSFEDFYKEYIVFYKTRDLSQLKKEKIKLNKQNINFIKSELLYSDNINIPELIIEKISKQVSDKVKLNEYRWFDSNVKHIRYFKRLLTDEMIIEAIKEHNNCVDCRIQNNDYYNKINKVKYSKKQIYKLYLKYFVSK